MQLKKCGANEYQFNGFFLQYFSTSVFLEELDRNFSFGGTIW